MTMPILISPFTFHMAMKPVGKGRPRFARGRTYTPETTRKAEQEILIAYLNTCGHRTVMSGPVGMTITISEKMPASKPKSLLRAKYLKTPDIDNVAKLVIDALNGVAYFDDKQIRG